MRALAIVPVGDFLGAVVPQDDLERQHREAGALHRLELREHPFTGPWRRRGEAVGQLYVAQYWPPNTARMADELGGEAPRVWTAARDAEVWAELQA